MRCRIWHKWCTKSCVSAGWNMEWLRPWVWIERFVYWTDCIHSVDFPTIVLSIYLSIYLSICLSISVCLSIFLSAWMSVCLLVCLSFCLSVCLSVGRSAENYFVMFLFFFFLFYFLSKRQATTVCKIVQYKGVEYHCNPIIWRYEV